MTRMWKVSSLLSILWALSLWAFGQSVSSLPTHPLIVSVVDAHGRADRSLTKENFRVHLNGKTAAVVDAHYRLAPRRIVVLLDMSGSMIGEARQKWQIAREALEDFLIETPVEAPIAMLTFSSQIQDRFGFLEGRNAITNWLNEHPDQPMPIKHSTRTALFDAMLDALQLLHPFQSGDAIYAITDGADNVSRSSPSQLRNRLLRSDIRVFAFLFADPAVGREEQEGETAFLNMVEASGGFAFSVHGHQRLGGPSWTFDYSDDKKTQDTVKTCSQALNILVHGFWTLELSAPLSSKDLRIRLEITDTEGKKRKDLRFVYPHLRMGREATP